MERSRVPSPVAASDRLRDSSEEFLGLSAGGRSEQCGLLWVFPCAMGGLMRGGQVPRITTRIGACCNSFNSGVESPLLVPNESKAGPITLSEGKISLISRAFCRWFGAPCGLADFCDCS